MTLSARSTSQETASGLRVTNVESGVVIAETDAMDLRDFERAVATVVPGEPRTPELLETHIGILDEDGSVDVIVAPWSGEALWRASIVGAPDAFHAFVPSMAGTLDHWRSTDGRAWSREGDVALLPEGSEVGCELLVGGAQPGFSPAGSRFGALALCPDGDRQTRYWWSEDGKAWTQALRPPANSDLPVLATSRGPVWHGVDANKNEWWVQKDGEWVRDPGIERAMRIPDRCQDQDAATRTWVFGDTIVTLSVPEDQDPHACERLVRIIEFGADLEKTTD